MTIRSMETVMSASTSRVTSADWISMYENKERPCVPALNDGGSNFDDAEEDDIVAKFSSMDPAMRFQSLFRCLDYGNMMPGLMGRGTVSDTTTREKLRQSLFHFGQELIMSPGSAVTSLEALTNLNLLSHSSGAAEGIWGSSLYGIRSSNHTSYVPTPFPSAAFHLLGVKPPANPNVNKPSIVMEKDILETDVLCGRGGKSNNHDGNKRYRHVIGDFRRQYRGTPTKNDKTALSRSIVEYVNRYGGRFLKMNKLDQWVILTTGEARRKTAQALRETKALKWM